MAVPSEEPMINLLTVLADTSPTPAQPSPYLLGGIAAIITASVAGWIAWRKLKPETTNIQVGSAETLIEIAVKAGTFVENQRNALDERVKSLEAQINDFRTRLDKAEDKTRAAEERANKAEAKVSDLSKKLEDEKRARHEAELREADLKKDVSRLWLLVEALRDIIKEAGIDIPQTLLDEKPGEVE